MHEKRIVLASDHAGFELKELLKAYLQEQGMEVIDVNPEYEEGDDYPAIVRKGCKTALTEGLKAIIFGGSGNGEVIAANKVRGIRCALVYSDEAAELARRHNDANAMSLGGRMTDSEDAKRFVDIFLSTEFDGGRHEKRIADLEPDA